ncbi:MAG TPA: helix-turn-helix transcriptional regulator [Isosphaeraceae bacterium]|jgi:hypothetical protein|nr:helix-turn-helix transcriptional regulator [Isosphaeraceae bacterium]
MNPPDRSRKRDTARSVHRDAVARRLRQVRSFRFGEEDGVSELADCLGIATRTWLNYEAGVTIPGEILLGFIELTGVTPAWLLHGTGNPFVDFLSCRKVFPN